MRGESLFLCCEKGTFEVAVANLKKTVSDIDQVFEKEFPLSVSGLFIVALKSGDDVAALRFENVL
jgi:hypothetical protein